MLSGSIGVVCFSKHQSVLQWSVRFKGTIGEVPKNGVISQVSKSEGWSFSDKSLGKLE